MSRVLVSLLLVAVCSQALALTPPRSVSEFQVDPSGHVFWIDSYGSLRRDGANTGWHPGQRFRVDEAGHAVYVDSYGRMCKDGYSYGSTEHDTSGSAADGTLYWINSWGEELMQEQHRLGYKASWQAAIRVDGAGNVLYVNPETQTLWRDGHDTGVSFYGLDFQVNTQGDVYYRTWLNNATCSIWRLDPDTGQRTFIDYAHNPPFLKLDGAGKVWYVGSYGQVMREKVAMYGLTYFGPFQLDAAGNVYTRRDDAVLKNGRPTGFKVEGHFAVTPGGDVFAIVDETWGRIQKNGMTLGFSVQ